MTNLLLDLRVAARAPRRQLGFSAVAVLTLTLGSGGAIAIFSLVYGVLLRPLPYQDPGRLVALWQTARDDPRVSLDGSISYANFLDWRRQARSFDGMALYSGGLITLTGPGEAEVVRGAIVTPGFFQVFGRPPVIGRDFTEQENLAGGPEVVIVSDGFWRERLGGRPDVLGRTVEISGRPRAIVGVTPPGFDFPRQARLWMPVRNQDERCGRGCAYLDGVARLAPGVPVGSAREEMAALARRLEHQYPNENANVTIGLDALHSVIVGDVRPALLILLAAVAMVLLIACANLANLQLARGAARRREVAVRGALGAGRRRLVSFLLAESVLLAAAGAVLGLLVATWGVDLLRAYSPTDLPRLEAVAVDTPSFLFALTLVGLTTILFGLGPAVHASQTTLASALGEGGRASAGGRHAGWSRSALLAGQVALSLMLLLGSGLLARSLVALGSVDPGFQARGTAIFTVSLPSARYPQPEDVVLGFERLDALLVAIPGVESVGRISGLPLGSAEDVQTFVRPDRPPPPPGRTPGALVRVVDGDYFSLIGIPVIAGRPFSALDRRDSQPVVIVSRRMAEEFWPGEDPIGRLLRIDSVDPEPRTIVGVVGNVRSQVLTAAALPEMYLPHTQADRRSVVMLLRSELPPGVVLAAARQALRSFDPKLPMIRPGPLQDVVDRQMARPRFYLLLLGLFTGLALVLAAVGLYGVVAYLVAQRTHEIAIRVALGARAAEVVRLMATSGIAPALLGLALGLAGALAAGRAMTSLLFEVRPHDMPTLIVSTILLLAVVIVACVIPAARATRIPPATVLRGE